MTDFELIHGLVDGNLSEADKAEAQARMFSDPNFKSQFDFAVAAKKALKTHCTGVDCEETWSKCRQRLNQVDRAKTVELNISKYAWAMVAGLTLLIGGVGIINRSDGGKRMHSADLLNLSANLVPQAALPTSVGKWLNGQGIDVKQNQLNKIQVLGYAHGYMNDREAFRVGLRDRTGDMALMIVKNAGEVDGTWSQDGSEYRYGQIEDLYVVTWKRGDRVMMLVGNRSLEELQSVAETLSSR